MARGREHRSPRPDFLAALATLLHPKPSQRGQSVKPPSAQFHFPIFATKTESRLSIHIPRQAKIFVLEIRLALSAVD